MHACTRVVQGVSGNSARLFAAVLEQCMHSLSRLTVRPKQQTLSRCWKRVDKRPPQKHAPRIIAETPQWCYCTCTTSVVTGHASITITLSHLQTTPSALCCALADAIHVRCMLLGFHIWHNTLSPHAHLKQTNHTSTAATPKGCFATVRSTGAGSIAAGRRRLSALHSRRVLIPIHNEGRL
jgi:hypothetical protein